MSQHAHPESQYGVPGGVVYRQHNGKQPDEHTSCLKTGGYSGQVTVAPAFSHLAVIKPQAAIHDDYRNQHAGHHGAEHRAAVQAECAKQNGHGHNHLGKPIEEHADGSVQVRFFEQWDFYTIRHFFFLLVNNPYTFTPFSG